MRMIGNEFSATLYSLLCSIIFVALARCTIVVQGFSSKEVVQSSVHKKYCCRKGGRHPDCIGGPLFLSERNNEKAIFDDSFPSIREEQRQSALVRAALSLNYAGSDLVTLYLVGQSKARLASTTTSGNKTQQASSPCVVLSPYSISSESKLSKSQPCLLLPLANRNELKLLSFATAKRRLSKSVLLGLNAGLVNRDGGLFDNLPWSTWSIDPQRRNYDAAGNPILSKFHLGKRDAYYRLMGKDWKGRSASIGNLALRAKYMLESEDEVSYKDVRELAEDKDEQFALTQRILELQVKEMQMNLAECEYKMAIIRTANTEIQSDLVEIRSQQQSLQDQIEQSNQKLELLKGRKDATSNSSSVNFLISVLDSIADWTTDGSKNAAPYRGAIGYAPMLDSKDDVAADNSMLPYTDPYDCLREIISEQLNAEVIGAVLENTSWFNGYTTLGGALVLRRITPTKKLKLAGESVIFKDEDEDLGNQGVQGGEVLVVECNADEAIGMALACNIPIQLESHLWQSTNQFMDEILEKLGNEEQDNTNNNNIWEYLPMWVPQEGGLATTMESDNQNAPSLSSTPAQTPTTTLSLFDGLLQSQSKTDLFPTDNPIQSLSDYDSLTNKDKVKILLSLSNFEGFLPRPRVVRQSQEATRSQATNPLDELLLPLIDESVRRQVLIRKAEQEGNMDLAKQMSSEKSKRQIAKEKAQLARERGDEEKAAQLENEAAMYAAMRADVTQDEGSYSRFLDRDEWYERQQEINRKKALKNKDSFGTLLDGIE